MYKKNLYRNLYGANDIYKSPLCLNDYKNKKQTNHPIFLRGECSMKIYLSIFRENVFKQYVKTRTSQVVYTILILRGKVLHCI